MAKTSKSNKYVYTWGNKKADGDGSMKPLLGCKGANVIRIYKPVLLAVCQSPWPLVVIFCCLLILATIAIGNSRQRAGTNVTVNIMTDISVNVFVHAKGRINCPSIPLSAKIGRNEINIIMTAKTAGRATIAVAFATKTSVSPWIGVSPNARLS